MSLLKKTKPAFRCSVDCTIAAVLYSGIGAALWEVKIPFTCNLVKRRFTKTRVVVSPRSMALSICPLQFFVMQLHA